MPVVAVACEIVQGTVSPINGAERLGWMASEYEQLAEALKDFTGLASVWEDDRDPARRAAYEHDITVEADRLMARFGK